MKKINIIYWISTGLLLALMLSSAIPTFINAAGTQAIMGKHLGYPAYFAPFLAVLKMLGVIAILVPGLPRLKEWAYAGFTFDLVGALFSFIAVGDKFKDCALFIVFFALLIVSYIYFHKRLKAKAKAQP